MIYSRLTSYRNFATAPCGLAWSSATWSVSTAPCGLAWSSTTWSVSTAPCGLAQYDVVLLDCTLRSGVAQYDVVRLDCTLRSGSVRRGPSRLHPAVWLSTTWSVSTAPCGLAQYDVVLLDCTLRSGSVRRGPSRLHPAVWLSTTWSFSTAPCGLAWSSTTWSFSTAPCGLAQYDVVRLDCTLRSGSVRRGPSRLHPAVWLSTTWSFSVIIVYVVYFFLSSFFLFLDGASLFRGEGVVTVYQSPSELFSSIRFCRAFSPPVSFYSCMLWGRCTNGRIGPT